MLYDLNFILSSSSLCYTVHDPDAPASQKKESVEGGKKKRLEKKGKVDLEPWNREQGNRKKKKKTDHLFVSRTAKMPVAYTYEILPLGHGIVSR